jgi:hypothetical protein
MKKKNREIKVTNLDLFCLNPHCDVLFFPSKTYNKMTTVNIFKKLK